MKLTNRKLLVLIVVPMFYGCVTHSSDELSDLRVAFRNFQPNETILRLEIATYYDWDCIVDYNQRSHPLAGALFFTDSGVYYFVGERSEKISIKGLRPEHITAARLREHWTYENISDVRIDDGPLLANCLVIHDKTWVKTNFGLIGGGSKGGLKANYEFVLEKIGKE